MENEITLTYKGKRKNGDKMVAAYINAVDMREWLFKKPLNNDYRIGMQTVCVLKSEKQIGAPFQQMGLVGKDLIEAWSIEERNDILRLQEEKDKAKDPEGHIDELIKAVKRNTADSRARRRIAMYIFNQLV